MKEKVVLLRPYYGVNIHSDAHGDLGERLNTNDVFPDLPFIISATILDESEKIDVRIIDAVSEGRLLPDELIEKLKNEKFDTVILKAAAPTVNSDLELLKQIKCINPESKVMIAGHVSKLLKTWIQENMKEIDYVIDEPLDEFVYKYVNKTENKCGINDLPSPNYALVNYKNYTDDDKNVRLTLQASRGCPMSCSYCPYTAFYQKVDYRDIDKVIEDIKGILKLGVTVIQFRDQYFTVDKKRIRELCNRIIEEKLEFKWICETRLDSLDVELVDLLKKAGVFLICFGIESGEETVLDKYNSHKGSPENLKKMIEYINKLGIITMAFYMIGFPEDTWETVEKTFKLALYLNSSYAIFNEYEECVFSNENVVMSPSLFDIFQNTTNVTSDSILDSAEKKYLVWLFSTIYTLNNDSLKKAYTYNYKIANNNQELISQISKVPDDLHMLSEIIRTNRKGNGI